MELNRCSIAHGDHHDGRCAWCGDTLPARHRRWCSEACSRAWAENHIWSVARAVAVRDADHRCERCGEDEYVEVHHDPPVGKRGYGMGCQHHQNRLHVLCATHHVEAHDLLRSCERPGTVTQLTLLDWRRLAA